MKVCFAKDCTIDSTARKNELQNIPEMSFNQDMMSKQDFFKILEAMKRPDLITYCCIKGLSSCCNKFFVCKVHLEEMIELGKMEKISQIICKREYAKQDSNEFYFKSAMRADLEEYGGVRRKKILLPKDFPVENDKVCQEVHKSVELMDSTSSDDTDFKKEFELWDLINRSSSPVSHYHGIKHTFFETEPKY